MPMLTTLTTLPLNLLILLYFQDCQLEDQDCHMRLKIVKIVKVVNIVPLCA